MRVFAGFLASVVLAGAAIAAAEPQSDCDVPEWLIAAPSDLNRVTSAIKERHRLDISVVGSRSSALPGPDGARFSYPAQLELILNER